MLQRLNKGSKFKLVLKKLHISSTISSTYFKSSFFILIYYRRRTLLNRGYAASVRNKKDNEEKILNIECDRIRRSITRRRDQLQDYLAHIEKCSHLICKLEDQSRLEIPEEYFSSDSEPDNNEFSKNYTFEHQNVRKFLNRNGTILEPVKDEEMSDDEY